LGIPIDTASRTRLEELVAAQPPVSGVRWLPGANWHVTVHFLGAVPEEMLPNLLALMQVGLRDREVFSLGFEGYMLAPRGQAPRMIWARYQRHPAYRALVQEVQQLCAPVVPPPQAPRRNPMPHITLARLRQPVAPVLPSVPLPDLPVDQLVLWASDLRPSGAQYTELGQWRLRPPAP